MKTRMIHAKQLDEITKVEFSYKDITIYQDGAIVVLDKEQIEWLSQILKNEKQQQEFWEKSSKKEG